MLPPTSTIFRLLCSLCEFYARTVGERWPSPPVDDAVRLGLSVLRKGESVSFLEWRAEGCHLLRSAGFILYSLKWKKFCCVWAISLKAATFSRISCLSSFMLCPTSAGSSSRYLLTVCISSHLSKCLGEWRLSWEECRARSCSGLASRDCLECAEEECTALLRYEGSAGSGGGAACWMVLNDGEKLQILRAVCAPWREKKISLSCSILPDKFIIKMVTQAQPTFIPLFFPFPLLTVMTLLLLSDDQ
jgi:hypothetical protein